jgi:regulator of extracellular matrix RemA (YlzA/DUF370 family)
MTKIRVFVPPTFEGVTTVAILEELFNERASLEVRYVKYVDFQEWNQFLDCEHVIVLGLPYKNQILPDEFFHNNDVAFMDFIHISTYGEQIAGTNIVSIVNPDCDPIKELILLLQEKSESFIISRYTTITDKASFLSDAVNAYRTWTWENNDVTRMLLALYHAGYTWYPRLIKGLSLQDIVKQYAPLIKGQMEKMEEYISTKRNHVRTTTLTIGQDQCLLKVVFAEEYINELANDLLTREINNMPVIVCVGRTTKSSDMFSIRTRNINAGMVAHLINKGSGKDSVASVFSGIGYSEVMLNAIITKLGQTQNMV